MTDLRLSKYVVEGPLVSRRNIPGYERLIFSTRKPQALVLPEGAWHSLKSGQIERFSTGLLDYLSAALVLVDGDRDELRDIILENQYAIGSDPVLYQVVQPTAACQLGCGYCGQAHVARLMSEAAQDSLIDRLRRQLSSGTYRTLSIGWFGAEPLLGLKVIRRLTPRFLELATAGQLTYTAKIVTNGVALTPAVAAELVNQHHVGRAEITLDGPAEVHDERRPTKSGEPSFDRIFQNLTNLRDAAPKLEVIVRCNVDRRNADRVPELIRHLAAANLQESVQVYFAPIHAWGNDADDEALSHETYGRLEIDWLAELHNLGFRIGVLPERKAIVCLAVRRDGELTDAFGNVFNCTEVSYVPAYGSPNRYALAPNLAGRTNAPFRTFNDDILSGRRSSCHSCVMLPVCGGSCPKLWEEGKVPCPSAKANISERLLLWYAIQQETKIPATQGDGATASSAAFWGTREQPSSDG